jgi:poly(beta-D-mannuronate) lyase
MAIRNILVLLVSVALFSCGGNNNFSGTNTLVKTNEELKTAIENAQAGGEIVLANGIWKNVEIEFTISGTKDKPIMLKAETAGDVFIEGKSFVKFGADYIVVRDLYFKNGYTPNNAVIEFRLKGKVANHCAVTNCVIEDFNQPQRDTQDHWVEFWGRNNELSNCNIIGKSNSGPTIRVQIKGNESIKNHHRIVNNHFGPRPRKGGPHGETLQIGDSETSMSPGNTLVANNLFDRCNGEVEVISSKTNYNEFRNNVFYKCEGSLVTRHGNYCIIDGNYFIGDDNSENIGGIRLVNTGHWVTNNYFYNLKGNNFRGPLAIMNGIPKSPLNRYNQVTDVVVAYNTWVDCVSPLHISVGANLNEKDVLPASEIRSERPERTIIANNVIYNDKNSAPIVAYDNVDGILFKNNAINHNPENEFQQNFDFVNFSVTKLAEYLYSPASQIDDVKPYQGFDFETIDKDLFGNSRENNNRIGAIISTTNVPDILENSKYGASWYSLEKEEQKPEFIQLTAAESVAEKIEKAKNGDIIELAPGIYEISKTINIDKKISIRSSETSTPAKLIFSGEENTPLFQLNPGGNLFLEEVVLEGNTMNYAFASLKKNMSGLYNVKAENCNISKFAYVLKAYKESFSDSITFMGCNISDCENGIELSEETNDKGDYNVEFLTIENCTFKNVKANVIDYYRGGYDESTIGGNLKLSNSEFENCGANEKNKILLNTRGIINVEISENTFKNNPVKLVALLWGAKNNSHSNNKIVNSGEIVVQENIKLTLMY